MKGVLSLLQSEHPDEEEPCYQPYCKSYSKIPPLLAPSEPLYTQEKQSTEGYQGNFECHEGNETRNECSIGENQNVVTNEKWHRQNEQGQKCLVRSIVQHEINHRKEEVLFLTFTAFSTPTI
jgi:hypothetical protein